MATLRPNLESRARYTSPIPPCPRWEIISYCRSRVPIIGREYYQKGAKNESTPQRIARRMHRCGNRPACQGKGIHAAARRLDAAAHGSAVAKSREDLRV